MAEYLSRYYKSITTKGCNVTLNIYKKITSSARWLEKEIGEVLVSLNYGIQGAEDAVDSPIQKTSLEFSLVDAPELNTNDKKCGEWEEFFTPDATGYKVELVIDDVVKWTGYITPDSWEEDLSYHAPISITARDNWGRLNDFKFDHKGNDDHLITVSELIMAAAEKAGLAMNVKIDSAVEWPLCKGIPLYDHYINVLAFEDSTWWDALEETLGSLGMCIQYVDNNEFVVTPLRSRCYVGNELYLLAPKKEFVFEHPGHRSLAPAVKEIVEVQNYDFSDDMINAPALTIGDFESGATYPFTSQPYGTTERMMPVFSLKPNGFWKQGVEGYYSLLCQFNYEPRQDDDSVRLKDDNTLFIACNPGTKTDYSYAQTQMRGVYCEVNMTRMRGKISIKVGAPVRLYGASYNTGTAPFSEEYTCPAISNVFARIMYTAHGYTPMCYNGIKWVSGAAYCQLSPPTNEGVVYEYEFVIPSADIDAPGVLHIEFKCGKYIILGDYEAVDANGNGMYMPITDVKLTNVWDVEAENKVTTKYNEDNNVILNRKPAIGCVNYDTISPQEVLNGVYSPEIGCPAAREWKWSAGELVTQLPVLIHQQLLTFYSKPNNILTGSMIVDAGLPSFDCLWNWKGKAHILLSGRVNLISGQMDGAVLREFRRYDHMWETWCETDDVEVDYAATSIQLRVHSNKTITSADLSGLPLWLIGSVQSAGNGVYVVSLAVEANSSSKRTAIINIDTAFVRITQLAPGDYGLDYGEDY